MLYIEKISDNWVLYVHVFVEGANERRCGGGKKRRENEVN